MVNLISGPAGHTSVLNSFLTIKDLSNCLTIDKKTNAVVWSYVMQEGEAREGGQYPFKKITQDINTLKQRMSSRVTPHQELVKCGYLLFLYKLAASQH